MNKQELFKQIKSRGIEEKELKEKYEEFKKWLKDKGISDKDLEMSVLARMQAYYKKVLLSPAKTFEGVIYAVDRVTDFGAQKLFKEAKQAYEEDRDRAISLGLTDEEGTPLYSGNRAPSQGKRVIDPENDRRQNIYLFAKCIEGEKVDKDYKEATLVLRPNKFDIDMPFFTKVKFKANVGNKTTEDKYFLNQSELLEFEVVDKKQVNVDEFVTKYLKANYVDDLTTLREWHDKHSDNFERKVVIKANISSIKFTASGTNNILNVDSPDLGLNGKTVTCWVPEYISLDIDETAMNLIIIGQTNVGLDKFSGEERVTISVLGLYCPDAFRIEKTEEHNIKEEQIKEVEQKSTDEEYTEEDW